MTMTGQDISGHGRPQSLEGRDPNLQVSDTQILDCPILVVDDTAFNRTLIGDFLAVAGFRKVSFATNGMEALAMVEAGIPDLLILDIMMPGIDGY